MVRHFLENAFQEMQAGLLCRMDRHLSSIQPSCCVGSTSPPFHQAKHLRQEHTMKRVIPNGYVLCALAVLAFTRVDDGVSAPARPSANSIQNFRAVDVSETVLQVTEETTSSAQGGPLNLGKM